MTIRLATVLLAPIASLLCMHVASARSVLAPGDVVVVTSDGFFLPDPFSAVPRIALAPAAFGGVTTLAHPAVEREPGADSFLVASGPHLHRVTITSLAPPQFAVVDLTPASALPLDLYDLEIDAATGELFALDQATDAVLRYAPPFSLGMTPVASLPVLSTARAIALDARSLQNAVIVASAHEVMRVPLDGSTSTLQIQIESPSGLDQDATIAGKQGTFVTAKGGNEIGRGTGSPNLLIELNRYGMCAPFALAPVDVEWDGQQRRAIALCEGGMNPACGGPFGAVGPNHVVRFPLVQAPGIAPTVVTYLGGSGITGTNGDLALVTDDRSFASPVGAPCGFGGLPAPTLDLAEPALSTSSTTATLVVAGAPANAPVVVITSLSAATALLPFGCSVLADPALVFGLGTTNGSGDLSVAIPVPPLPSGLDIDLQAACGSPMRLSERLFLHVAN